MTSDDGKIFMMITRPEYDLSNSFDKIRNRLNELTNNFHFIAIQLQDSTCKHNSLSIEKILDKKMLSYTILHHLPLKRTEADLGHKLMKLL